MLTEKPKNSFYKHGSQKARAKLYREAARTIEREQKWWCCNQLSHMGAEDLIDPFAQYFRPRDTEVGSWWPHGEWGPRIIALCLMAAMVEAGDA